MYLQNFVILPIFTFRYHIFTLQNFIFCHHSQQRNQECPMESWVPSMLESGDLLHLKDCACRSGTWWLAWVASSPLGEFVKMANLCFSPWVAYGGLWVPSTLETFYISEIACCQWSACFERTQAILLHRADVRHIGSSSNVFDKWHIM